MVTSRLPIDRLADTATPVEVLLLTGVRLGESAAGAREPHRHDYHELVWIREGTGQHLLDGRPVTVQPRTITLIGRGQVHVFQRADAVHGAVVRFGEELLHGGPAARANPLWLLAGRAGRTVPVPEGDVARLDSAIETLAAETSHSTDACTAELQRHLLSVLLLWIERWYDASRAERPEADEAEVQLYRRFTQVLERDFPHHHDAAHYAEALAVPPAALSRALSQVTGRSTKELVTDRVMLEAARLLRFTDLTVGQIAHQVGFADQLYFSRAFKRHAGEAPMAFRRRALGKA